VNAFLEKELREHPTNEKCDVCNGLIVGWDWPNSFLLFDGRIACNNCRTDLLKQSLDIPTRID
jgi:hypothetical protein